MIARWWLIAAMPTVKGRVKLHSLSALSILAGFGMSVYSIEVFSPHAVFCPLMLEESPLLGPSRPGQMADALHRNCMECLPIELHRPSRLLEPMQRQMF